MRKSIVAGVAMTSAAAFALIAPGQATADPSDTTTVTFTIASGTLSITAPDAEDLVVNEAVTEATAAFSAITVTDNRRGTADWSAYVNGSGFTRAGNAAGLPADYTPGVATKTGTVNLAPSGTLTLPGSGGQAAIIASGVQGVNTATWTPTVRVAVPTDALAGTYTSTITHSVS